MNPVIEAFRRLIPVRHRMTGRGWVTFNCPACGDRKGRGAFRETSSGGFRYNCKNGGCEYETNTGWEPGHGFFGRPQQLLEYLGGSMSNIPLTYLLEQRGITYGENSNSVNWTDVPRYDPQVWGSYAQWLMDENVVSIPCLRDTARGFTEISLPPDSELLFKGSITKDKEDVQAYVLDRGILFYDHPFLWTPKYPRYAIYPFLYRKKIIGWIGRAIDLDNPFRHRKCADFPTDFMLHQDAVYDKRVVYVQEGVFDAIALNSLCTFGNVISKRQINFLCQTKDSNKKVILIPDIKQREWSNYIISAKENGFLVSVPDYPGNSLGEHIKDAGESIKRNGLLLTVEAILDGITDNYVEAQVKLMQKTKG